MSSGADLTWPEHAKKVKDAFVHAYAGYKTYVFGVDKLIKSISNGGVNESGSWLWSGSSPSNSMDGVSPLLTN